MSPRDIAINSFWTERKLVRLFTERTGRETFSLKDLIAFAESLPPHVIADISEMQP